MTTVSMSSTSLREVAKKNVSDSERRGSLVAGTVLLGYGLVRRSIPLTTLGAYLAYRGQTGRCRIYQSLGVSSRAGASGLLTTFTKTVTVNRPRGELFRFFRELEDPLGSLRHLRREPNGDGARWYVGRTARLPVRWELAVTELRENELISWTSAERARLAMRYAVELEDAPRKRGTVVRLRISYVPPGGGPGAALGKMFGVLLSQRAGADLRRMKQFLEGGEIATTRGQPSGPSMRRRLTNPLWRTT